MRKALAALDMVRRAGVITTADLAESPGWNRVDAWRYLRVLEEEGWLMRFSDRPGVQKYALGRSARDLANAA